MWCAVPKLKLRKGNQWLSPVPKPSSRMLSEYSSCVPKFWSLENCRSVCVERELYIFLPAHNPCCTVVAMTFVFLCGGIIYWMCPRWSPCYYFICFFACLFFVFPLCCGGRCIWAWCAFRYVPFRCTPFLLLCFVVVFFKCCSVIYWPTSLGGCWISSVSKCCSVVPMRPVLPNGSQCGQDRLYLWSWFGFIGFILKVKG